MLTASAANLFLCYVCDTCLLTAITAHRGLSSVFPCPFYCVDEIDAALDTRAVSAVASVVQRLSNTGLVQNECEADGDAKEVPANHTQFIVVSHRPQMYGCARRLLGVYCGGPTMGGSSTVCGWQL
jgi:chromosome segregation ATPase